MTTRATGGLFVATRATGQANPPGAGCGCGPALGSAGSGELGELARLLQALLVADSTGALTAHSSGDMPSDYVPYSTHLA